MPIAGQKPVREAHHKNEFPQGPYPSRTTMYAKYLESLFIESL